MTGGPTSRNEPAEHIGPKRRRSSEEALDRIAVRTKMAGLVKRMARLHEEAIVLETLWAIPLRRERVKPRVVALGREIAAVEEAFEDLLEGLLPRQREHSRVSDIERSLRGLASRVPRLDALSASADRKAV